jgi:hypothetical protein
MKRIIGSVLCAILCGILAASAGAQELKRIALKSGESTELRNYFWIVNCVPIMIGQPKLDVLEGPEEVVVTLKEGPVLPRGRGCPKPVPGGAVIVTAKEIPEHKEARLTIRLQFNTKQGDRQDSNTYLLTLFPGGENSHTNTPSNTSTAPATAQ